MGASFTVSGGFLKALVAAYGAVGQSELYISFTRAEAVIQAFSPDRARLIDIRLMPLDYRCDEEKFWVQIPYLNKLVDAIRTFKKAEEVRVEVRDGVFYVGSFSVGKVVKEEDIFLKEYFIVLIPKFSVDAKLRVVTSDFRRLVKQAADFKIRDYTPSHAYGMMGIKVKGRTGTIIFFDERTSRLDISGYEPWLVDIDGEGMTALDLQMFSPGLVLGLSELVEVAFQHAGIVQLTYSDAWFTVRYMQAPRLEEEGKLSETFLKELERVPVARRLVWTLREDEVKLFEKALRAINDIYAREKLYMTMLEAWGLWIYWKEYANGYFRISKSRFWEFQAVPERLSGAFTPGLISSWMKDVEEVSCFLEGEPPEAIVLVGKGAKIATRELRSEELVKEIEVPEVRGVGLFSGPPSVLHDVFEDALVAEEAFLVFASGPFEIVVAGRDRVYYRASLPVDSFTFLEEDFMAVDQRYFKALRDFFSHIPALGVVLGKQDESNIFLRVEADDWELAAGLFQTVEEVADAVKFYREEILKPPPPPPEVTPLPEVAPPVAPPIEYATVYILADVPTFIGADDKTYGPFKAGEEAWMPKPNADALVREGRASLRKPPEVAPPPPVPPVPPPVEVKPPPKLTSEETGRLADRFLNALREAGVPLPTIYKAEFEKAMDIYKTYEENVKIIDKLASEIIARVKPPPVEVKPPPPPAPPPPVAPPPVAPFEERVEKLIKLAQEWGPGIVSWETIEERYKLSFTEEERDRIRRYWIGRFPKETEITVQWGVTIPKPPPPAPPPPAPPPIEYEEVRFLRDVPAIVGEDLKTYGPFKAGDVAKLPRGNADALVRQGAATYEFVPPIVPVAEEAIKELEGL